MFRDDKEALAQRAAALRDRLEEVEASLRRRRLELEAIGFVEPERRRREQRIIVGAYLLAGTLALAIPLLITFGHVIPSLDAETQRERTRLPALEAKASRARATLAELRALEKRPTLRLHVRDNLMKVPVGSHGQILGIYGCLVGDRALLRRNPRPAPAEGASTAAGSLLWPADGARAMSGGPKAVTHEQLERLERSLAALEEHVSAADTILAAPDDRRQPGKRWARRPRLAFHLRAAVAALIITALVTTWIALAPAYKRRAGAAAATESLERAADHRRQRVVSRRAFAGMARAIEVRRRWLGDTAKGSPARPSYSRTMVESNLRMGALGLRMLRSICARRMAKPDVPRDRSTASSLTDLLERRPV